MSIDRTFEQWKIVNRREIPGHPARAVSCQIARGDALPGADSVDVSAANPGALEDLLRAANAEEGADPDRPLRRAAGHLAFVVRDLLADCSKGGRPSYRALASTGTALAAFEPLLEECALLRAIDEGEEEAGEVDGFAPPPARFEQDFDGTLREMSAGVSCEVPPARAFVDGEPLGPLPGAAWILSAPETDRGDYWRLTMRDSAECMVRGSGFAVTVEGPVRGADGTAVDYASVKADRGAVVALAEEIARGLGRGPARPVGGGAPTPVIELGAEARRVAGIYMGEGRIECDGMTMTITPAPAVARWSQVAVNLPEVLFGGSPPAPAWFSAREEEPPDGTFIEVQMRNSVEVMSGALRRGDNLLVPWSAVGQWRVRAEQS